MLKSQADEMINKRSARPSILAGLLTQYYYMGRHDIFHTSAIIYTGVSATLVVCLSWREMLVIFALLCPINPPWWIVLWHNSFEGTAWLTMHGLICLHGNLLSLLVHRQVSHLRTGVPVSAWSHQWVPLRVTSGTRQPNKLINEVHAVAWILRTRRCCR